MEGDGSSDGVNREFGVEEGGARMRAPRTRKPRGALTTWSERTLPSREKTSTEAEVEASGEVRHESRDSMDVSEADSLRDRRPTVADAAPWENVADADGVTNESFFEGRSQGPGEGTAVVEVSGWRNPRVHSQMKRVRSARAPQVTEPSERSSLGQLADLLDSGARGPEASGSGEREDQSAVIGFSSDEEDAVVTGKKPVPDVIDLAGDSPLPGVNGMISNGSEEAVLFQSSAESPPRRLMQRPASADAKRARRHLRRSGVAAQPDDRTVEDGVITPENRSEIQPPGDVAPPLPEPYNLRRGRSLNVGRALSNTAIRGRHRRHRLPLGGNLGFGYSDHSNIRRPFSVPSSSGSGNADARSNPVVNLEDQDSPTVGSRNTIVLEDDGDSDRARQLAEDERVARELQDSFTLEGPPPADEVLARMLQAEENAHGRGLPIEQRPVFFARAGMRSLLGGDEDEREARRNFRNELAQGHVSDNVASSSRIVRRGYGRNSALSRTVTALSAPTPGVMNARRVQFPARMGLESRMEFLAALEMALEQVPVGLQLAHVNRDFNENDYEMLLALDTDNHRHRGASLESISTLPVTIIAPTDVIDEDCSICLETPKAGDSLKRLPCMHAFHQGCIDRWLQQQAVCPVCKAHI